MRERGGDTCVGGSTFYVFIGWFLYVPWPGIKPTTLVYLDSALTNFDTRSGLFTVFEMVS